MERGQNSARAAAEAIAAIIAGDAETGLRDLAAALQPYLPTTSPTEDGWMDTKAAAAYVGLTPNALHKLTAAREVPFAQDAPGGKCWFKRSELDAWRRGEVSRSFPSALRAA